MNSACGTLPLASPAEALAAIMTSCGFSVRVWRGQRVYLDGYGRDINAYLAPLDLDSAFPADKAKLVVRSSWQAHRYNGLRCKGVKHAIWKDLFQACLVSAPPPERWQDVPLADDAPVARTLRPYLGQRSTGA